jgi:hypothetical protein
VSGTPFGIKTVIRPPPSNHGGGCPHFFTTTRHLYDGLMT